MGKHSRIELGPHDALVIVDLQNDFCPGGSLPATGGDLIVPVINRLIEHFSVHASEDGEHAGMIVATKDWHEGQHPDYPWPLHCIQGTRGAEFHPDLRYPYDLVFYKGYPGGSGLGYSGFDAVYGTTEPEDLETIDEALSLTETKVVLHEELTLERVLRLSGIERLFVVGLATDYCVKATVLDALKLKFEVCVIIDAIAAVNINPDDGEKALQEMIIAGVDLCTSAFILRLRSNEEELRRGKEGCGDCGDCGGYKDCKDCSYDH